MPGLNAEGPMQNRDRKIGRARGEAEGGSKVKASEHSSADSHMSAQRL